MSDQKERAITDSLNCSKIHKFAPFHLSDITVVYDDHEFHLHKSILSIYSTYFASLIEGDKLLQKVTVPTINEPLFGLPVGPKSILALLQTLYAFTPIDASFLFADVPSVDVPSDDENPDQLPVVERFAPRFDAFCILSHYFDIQCIERHLQDFIQQRIRAQLESFMLKSLLMAEFYKWQKTVSKLIVYIGLLESKYDRAHTIHAHRHREDRATDEYHRLWGKLSVQSQYLIMDIKESCKGKEELNGKIGKSV